MRKFWKDYYNLLKLNAEFYKEHTVGCILIICIMSIAGVIGFYWDDLTTTFNKKIHKNNYISKEIES
jgi:hypothetical protein